MHQIAVTTALPVRYGKRVLQSWSLNDLDDFFLVSGAVEEALQDPHLTVLVQRNSVHVLVL